MTKKSLTLALLLLVLTGATNAAKQPPHNFFGLNIGMEQPAALSRLQEIATPEGKKVGRSGTREVWILKRDSKYNYLITKYGKDQRLNWITVVAHPKRVRYSEIASLNLATKATDGINFSYKWKVPATSQQPAVIIIARGSDKEFLTSYSVYPTVSH